MLKQFYEKALPSQGVYCVSGIDQEGKVVSRFAETLEDAFKLVEKFKNKKVNVYVTPATFEGYSRKADSCVFVKSFFIDIDTHGKDSYETKEATLEALNKLLEITGLPEPTCVDSGGGIHAYWIMDRDIPYEEWKPLAEKFKSLCLKHINIDKSVTSDGARLLRCPDTLNYRYDPPALAKVISEVNVYDFDEFKEFMDSLEEDSPVDPFANVRKGLDEDTLAMKKIDNYEWVFQRIAERSLGGDGCGQIKYLLENQQIAPRDQWAGGLTIAVHCVDGNTAIHDMSNKYENYNYDETEKTARSFGGPRKCDWFAKEFPEQCKGCKHRGHINTPIVLGKTIKEATEETPIVTEQSAADINALLGTQTYEAEPVRETQNTEKIPVFPDYLKPFIRGENGGVYFVPPPKKDKKGGISYEDPIEVLPHLLFPVRRLVSPIDGECMTMKLILPNDGVKEFLLPMKAVYALEELKKTLSFHQVIYTPSRINNIQEYLVKWSQYMINTRSAQQMRMQLGWTALKDDEEEWPKRSFVLGGKEINMKGEIVDSPYSPYIKSIIKYIKPMGTLEKWQECANQLNRPGFELHAMTCLSGFGSTLMAYMTTPGIVIVLFGRSGSAKTGAMYSGLSVFGNPEGLSVFDSTDMGLTQRMLALKNMMYGVDEVGNKDPKPLSQLVHNISSGKAKIRLQASVNAEREHEQSASLITYMTTNESLTDKFQQLKGSPDGESARNIELFIDQPADLVGPEGARLGKAIFNPFKSNYGHAGPMFIKKVIELGDAYIESRTNYWDDRYLQDTKNGAEYRFHGNFVAAVMTAGEIVVNMGLLNYDLERIYQRIIKELNNIKLNVVKLNSTDYAAILNDFIYENMGNILRIKDGKVIDEPRGKLVARVSTDEPTRISKEALKEYLIKRKISPREFEKHMSESGEMIDKGAKKHLETGWKATTSTKAGYVYLFKNTMEFTGDKSDSDN